jgi:signal transduction histidine kinase
MVAGFTLLVYRARLQQGLAWWQEACGRERTLREFAELTAARLRGEGLLDELAERFRAAFGEDGRCAIVLAEGDGFRIMAAAGYDAETAATLEAQPLAPPVAKLLAEMITGRRAVVRPQLSEAERRDIGTRWRKPFSAQSLVALPLVAEEVVAGAVVLSGAGPRVIAAEELLLWQAMANQLGVAVANARLLERLREALRAKSEFLNTMSHELRSPLHVIVGYADMAREEAAASEVAVQALDRVRASALELLQLVENTMNAARLDAGKVPLRVEEFAPEELARDLAESVRALPEAGRGVDVRWEIAPDLPRVRLDRLKVKEIVQNLVSNALKFTPRGEVRVSLGREGDRLHIAVRDTGLGIPPEAQARIFGMFERVERVDIAGPAGIGLGLYIVNRLVELMRGKAALESTPGAGSCFTVLLPLWLDGATGHERA